MVLPGLVDPHSHLPFAGTRQDEFQLKLQGVSYQEIAAGGGGIKGTVRKTREIGLDELVARPAAGAWTGCCSAAPPPWKPRAATAWTWRPS